ncbi:MAG: transposase [Tannerellaceae bacterium]|nr:transposase [Tannerellaceae bacterium]
MNPRIVLWAPIIKYLCNLDDRETVDQISENVYMQYFLYYKLSLNAFYTPAYTCKVNGSFNQVARYLL